MLTDGDRSEARADRAPVLVLGIGNTLLRDEGVGVHVVEALRAHSLPEGVELCDGGTGGMDLLDVMEGRRTVIVVDAMQADHPPGTVLRLTPADLMRPTGGGISIHEFGLLDTLGMARLMGTSPGEVVIFAIQPKDISLGLELSPELAATVPRVVETILAEFNA